MIDIVTVWLAVALSDDVVFRVAEVSYLAFVCYAFVKDRKFRKERRSQAGSIGVTRGGESMAWFHAQYVAIAFVILLLTLNVDVIKGYRTIYTLVNIGLLAYLWAGNGWFRNLMIGLKCRSSKVEE